MRFVFEIKNDDGYKSMRPPEIRSDPSRTCSLFRALIVAAAAYVFVVRICGGDVFLELRELLAASESGADGATSGARRQQT